VDFVDPCIQRPFILCFSDLDGVATISIAMQALRIWYQHIPNSGLMARRVLELKSIDLCDY